MSTRTPRRIHAFTLVELVVALAITAVLAVLATAGYTEIVRRSHRLDARAALAAIASAQERHYLRHSRYAVRLAASGDALDAPDPSPPDDDPEAAAAASTLRYGSISPDGHYALALRASEDALEFTAAATPLGAQRADTECAAFQLDHSGRRTATDSRGIDTTARCWR